MVALAGAAFVGIYVFQLPFPVIVLAAGAAGWIGSRWAPHAFKTADHGGVAAYRPGLVDAMFERGELAHAEPSRAKACRALAIWLPIWLGPVFASWLLTGSTSVWSQISVFFGSMAVVTFGGAYAVLAYVAQAAVDTFGWLAPGEMVDGLGLAETTPGPLILVLQFVGFLAAYRDPGGLDPMAAGCLGALLTTWVTFAPCFLWIFLGAPYVEALRGNRAVLSALSAVTAAVLGVILNLALWFAIHFLFAETWTLDIFGTGPSLPVLGSLDWRAALLCAGALSATLVFHTRMPSTMAGSAAAAMILFQF